MVMRPIRLAIVFAALIATNAVRLGTATAEVVRTPIDAPHAVRLGDLLGRTPSEVQAILEPQAAGWPITFSLEGGSVAHPWSIAQAGDLLQDAAAVEAMAKFRQGGSSRPDAASCQIAGVDGSRSPSTLLVFKDGHLASVWTGDQPTPLTPLDSPVEEVLSRNGRTPASAADQRVISCERTRFVTGRSSGSRAPVDTAGILQGLALLPLAVGLSLTNPHRVANRQVGAATYQALVPGTIAPHQLKGVRRAAASSADRPDLLVVDLGAFAGRNLDAPDDVGVVAVRGDTVLWRALPWTNAAIIAVPPVR